MVVEPELLLPVLAAVLAGAVFGDHCSPISDTTIMSATGAGVNVIDHVMTQLPYAIISAVIAAIGYLVLGLNRFCYVWLYNSSGHPYRYFSRFGILRVKRVARF